MENLLLFLASSLVSRNKQPRFRRHLIGATGCSTLLVDGNNTLHYKYTTEGDRVYFYDELVNNIVFGSIIVQMKEVYTLQQAENILAQYIKKLQRPFGISCHFAMDVRKQDGQVTIEDYWQDGKGMDWKIKGYSNGKTLAVLYVKNLGQSAVAEHDAFLHGFRFSRFY